MNWTKRIALLAMMSLSTLATASELAAVSLSHFETPQKLVIEGLAGTGSNKLAGAGPVRMSFDALGRSFEIALTPNSNLLAAAGESATGKSIPYRGQLAGAPGSWARITVIDGVPTGLIWDGKELLAIERPGSNLAGSDTSIVYRLADTVVAAGAMTCGNDMPIVNGGSVYKSLVDELTVSIARAPGAVVELDLGAIGDFEFFQRHGPDARDEIITRLNNVDGIFSREVGVQINVPVVEVFTDANDPFTETNAGDLLDELATYRGSSSAQNSNGLTHLWTGKDVLADTGANSTVGIAFTGALCNRQFGAALSEGRSSPGFDSLIAAHEIGHNFGAPHDGVSGACESAPESFLMSTILNGSQEFSHCSKDEMADDIERAEIMGCIKALPSVDMRVNLSGADPVVLLGNAANITFIVENAGTVPATNVTADFTLPNNVSLISAAVSLGTCNAGAGTVTCDIGDVGGTSVITVTLTSDTTATGLGVINASVRADIDDNTSNNADSALLTVQPAVDLVVSAPGSRRIAVDARTSISVAVENASILDATAVALEATLSSGLQADSASWPAGTCTVSGSRIDCQATTLRAGSMSTFTIGVTGTNAGAGTVRVSMSSLEADAEPSDNSASATVTVGSDDDSGGGGSPGFLALLTLFAAGAYRKLLP